MVLMELMKNIKWYFVNKANKMWLDKSSMQIESGLRKWFESATGESLDFENPQTFNQKIQWLKLYDSTEEKGKLADKYEVREWVKEKIGDEYLIPCFGVWNSFEEIDFTKLPDSFVLKTNHGSSTNVIVKDKNNLNKTELRLRFKRWMSTNYALKMGFELHYGLMEPKILCEKYMGDDLTDYKLFCFGGKPDFFWVDVGRYSEHKRNTYDLEWNELPFVIDNFERCVVEKPKTLKQMIEIATILSEGYSFVRVDFYEIDGKLYFGEMTFTSSSGRDSFNPPKYNLVCGKKIVLPEKKTIPLKEIKKYWGK